MSLSKSYDPAVEITFINIIYMHVCEQDTPSAMKQQSHKQMDIQLILFIKNIHIYAVLVKGLKIGLDATT